MSESKREAGGVSETFEVEVSDVLEVALLPEPTPARIDGVVVGKLVGFGPAGEAMVAFMGAPGEGLPARATTVLDDESVGREVALLFEGGDPRRPIVMGLIHAPVARSAARPAEGLCAEVDGERLVLRAEAELVLECGEASITLTRDGKIVIRGAHVVTRAAGVNRILGGSVQIN